MRTSLTCGVQREKSPIGCPLHMGEKAAGLFDGEYFPQETKDALKEISVAIKGPVTTPIGEGLPLPQRRATPATRFLRLRAAGVLLSACAFTAALL
jgi:hypothetical protein